MSAYRVHRMSRTVAEVLADASAAMDEAEREAADPIPYFRT